jgi:hypothetical protein
VQYLFNRSRICSWTVMAWFPVHDCNVRLSHGSRRYSNPGFDTVIEKRIVVSTYDARWLAIVEQEDSFE